MNIKYIKFFLKKIANFKNNLFLKEIIKQYNIFIKIIQF